MVLIRHNWIRARAPLARAAARGGARPLFANPFEYGGGCGGFATPMLSKTISAGAGALITPVVAVCIALQPHSQKQTIDDFVARCSSGEQ